LEKNATPRMYYADQMQRHMGRKDEVCDYVLKLDDCPYDVAFIKEEGKNEFTPVFDTYKPYGLDPKTRQWGSLKGIADFLGAEYNGPVHHWSGHQEESEEATHAIGKLLQQYSKHAAMNAATAAGYYVESCEVDGEGEIVLTLGGM
jgi:hypothetical protein